MTDQELLELAAKAVGIKAQYSDNFGDFSIGEPYSKGEVRWNPLDFDDDAFRLAAQLSLKVDFLAWYVIVQNWRSEESVEECKNTSPAQEDLLRAARRAIVRAAACDPGRKK